MSKKYDNDYWTIPSDYSQLDHIVANYLGIEQALVLRLLYSMSRYKKQQHGIEWFQGSLVFWQSKLKFISQYKLKAVFEALTESGLIEKRTDHGGGNWYQPNQPQIEAMLKKARDQFFDDSFVMNDNSEHRLVENQPTSWSKTNQQLVENQPTLLTLVSPIHPRSVPNDSPVGETTGSKRKPPIKVSRGPEVFEAYREAYLKRYGCDPIRNLKANSICKRAFEMLGQEAPALVQHYVSMNKRWYVERSHSLECFITDVQSVKTSFVTGKTMTSTRAAEIDKEQSFREVIYGIQRQGSDEFELFEGVERPSQDYLDSPKVLRERAQLTSGATIDPSPTPLCETVPVAKPPRDS